MIRKLLSFAVLAAVLPLGLAQAQDYPSKPLRMIVPFPPGGGTDILARLVAAQLAEATKWTIVADNRAGAGGTIGIAEAARAPANGYVMVMGQKDNMVVAPWLYKNVNYDPTKDLVAVAHIAYTPVVIVTNTNSRFKTIKDVVDEARAKPDGVTYGSPGNGTTIHLAAEIFKASAKAKILHVPYKGSNPAMLDVLAGNVDLLVSSVPSALAQIKAGKLRPLAVTSAVRSTSLPDVPTLAELGYKDVDVSTWYGLFMPAGTPAQIVARVNGEVNKMLARAEVKAAIFAQGAEPQSLSTEQFSQLLNKEYKAWRTIVKESGATVE